MRAALLVGLVAAIPSSASAQSACDADAAALLRDVRASLVRYADPQVAELDGFRPISHDFPGMGEHWINLRHAALDRFDPAHPPILLYARRAGAPRLVGAAFVALRDPGEVAPGPASLRGAWHEHSGTLDQELFAADHHADHDDGGFAVLVLHVWTTPPYKGGWFDVQNWRLPWLRAGLEPREDVDAARAISLVESRDYYREALLRGGVPLADARELDALLDDAAARARARSGSGELGPVWRELLALLRERWPAVRGTIDGLDADPRVDVRCTD